MQKFFSFALVFAALGVASIGCGSGGGSSSGGGGAGGSTDTGGTTTTTTTTSMSTTTPTMTTSSMTSTDCKGIAPQGPAGACPTCSEGSCCAELAACNAVGGCVDCVYNGVGCDALATTDEADALYACLDTSCATDCQPPSNCNPVTNEGCNAAAGEACDFAQWGSFACYPAPNDNAICTACGSADGYCQGGMTCAGTCAKFCCDDGDCGTGKCDSTNTGGVVGICVDMADATKPACDPPAMSPSMGACFTIK